MMPLITMIIASSHNQISIHITSIISSIVDLLALLILTIRMLGSQINWSFGENGLSVNSALTALELIQL